MFTTVFVWSSSSRHHRQNTGFYKCMIFRDSFFISHFSKSLFQLFLDSSPEALLELCKQKINIEHCFIEKHFPSHFANLHAL